jgi:uncharacterized membrane protein YqjE
MVARDSTKPLTSVLTQVFSEVAYLLQTEIRLAKAEMSENIGRAANGGAFIGAGAVFALAGLFVLLLGAVRWLAVAGLPEQWGFTLVGGVVVVLGVVVLMKGIRNIRASSLVPERTVGQMRADFSVLKEQVK